MGSTTRAVRTNYISEQLLLQMESALPDCSPKHAESRFSVMYLTLRKEGVPHYLQIDILVRSGNRQVTCAERRHRYIFLILLAGFLATKITHLCLKIRVKQRNSTLALKVLKHVNI